MAPEEESRRDEGEPQPSNIDMGSESAFAERGARSLMDMCLASLSQQMVEQQEQNDAPENRYDRQQDIVGAQLQELEDHFGDSQTGWSPLRKVIRECGISMVTRLIKTGALTEKTATALALPLRLRPFLLDFVGAVLEALVKAPPHLVDPGHKFDNLPSMDMVLSQDGQPYDMWTTRLSCQ
ncbi:hypothetical protein PV04_01042 [Phialophora macrospora]|uniref:Uncharacterized protein n=1 Tax=Phialophora macrospora TaxID=1851006 RepID=A0A0D2D5L2_9EURO|nr:hypothetical protein PV04_01042 [Phialophora macrospora]